MNGRGELVLAAQDGITGHYTGVGTVAQAHVRVLKRTAKACEALFGTTFHLSAVTTRRIEPTHAHDPKTLAASRRACRATGGDVYLVDDGDPHGEWIGLEAWKAASSAAARIALDRQSRSEVCLRQSVDLALIAMDVPFAGAAAEALEARTDAHGARRAVFTPQSTASNQAAGKGAAIDEVRHDWEVQSARGTLKAGGLVGAASPFAEAHLTDEWGLERNSLTPHVVGIDPQDPRYGLSVARMRTVLAQHGIPTDRPLIVSMGRAEPEKSLDVLLRVQKQSLGDAVRVVIAGIYSAPGEPIRAANRDVVRELSALARADTDTILSYRFDATLGRALLGWPWTRVVLVPSRSEPLGMLGLETRYLARPRAGHADGATLMLAKTPGLVDHASAAPMATRSETSGENLGADVVDIHGPGGIEALEHSIYRAVTRPLGARRRMRAIASAALAPYLLPNTLPTLLASLLPGVVLEPRRITELLLDRRQS